MDGKKNTNYNLLQLFLMYCRIVSKSNNFEYKSYIVPIIRSIIQLVCKPDSPKEG